MERSIKAEDNIRISQDMAFKTNKNQKMVTKMTVICI